MSHSQWSESRSITKYLLSTAVNGLGQKRIDSSIVNVVLLAAAPSGGARSSRGPLHGASQCDSSRELQAGRIFRCLGRQRRGQPRRPRFRDAGVRATRRNYKKRKHKTRRIRGGGIKEDKKLWNWVSTQRKKFKKGKLKKDYIYNLNKIESWWWTEIHKGYLENKHWFIDNPNIIPPKKDFCMTEFNWYTKIKNYYVQNKLHEYEIKLINTIPIIQEWIKYGSPVKKTDENYKIFRKKYQHLDSIISRDEKGRKIKKNDSSEINFNI